MIEDLRQRHAGVAQQGKLQGDTKAVAVLAPHADQGHFLRFERIEPGKIIPIRRYPDKQLPFVLGQQFTFAHPGLASCP